MVNKGSIYVSAQSNDMRSNMFKLRNAGGAICGLGLH